MLHVDIVTCHDGKKLRWGNTMKTAYTIKITKVTPKRLFSTFFGAFRSCRHNAADSEYLDIKLETTKKQLGSDHLTLKSKHW